MTAKKLFQEGILQFDFETVVKTIGLEKAVEWGDRVAGFQDISKDGKTYPLSGFRFQTTYDEYRKKQINPLRLQERNEAVQGQLF